MKLTTDVLKNKRQKSVFILLYANIWNQNDLQIYHKAIIEFGSL